jgi:hypothetical protein
MGLGLIGSGIFVTDPIAGYPPQGNLEDGGAAEEVPRTREGTLHNLCAVPIFFGIPLAGTVSAIAAARRRDSGWASYSACSTVAMFASVALMSKAFGGDPRFAGKGGLFQRIAITSGLGWASALSFRALVSSLRSSI